MDITNNIKNNDDLSNYELNMELNPEIMNELYKELINNELNCELNNDLYELINELNNNELNTQLNNNTELNTLLNNTELNNQLNTQLNNQLNTQLNNQLNTQLNNQLNTQLNNQLNTQLNNNEIDYQLNTQLNTELNNQLNTQLNNNEIDYQLNTQLNNNEINNQLNTQLNNNTELNTLLNNTEINNQLNTELNNNEINNQLNNQLNTDLNNNEINNQLNNELNTDLNNTEINNQLNNELNTDLNNNELNIINKEEFEIFNCNFENKNVIIINYIKRFIKLKSSINYDLCKKYLMKPQIYHENINILEKLIKIFNKFNIDYWATGGTLLGAIRHNDMIPWDDDIDITILDNNRWKFETLKKYLEEEGLVIEPGSSIFNISDDIKFNSLNNYIHSLKQKINKNNLSVINYLINEASFLRHNKFYNFSLYKIKDISNKNVKKCVQIDLFISKKIDNIISFETNIFSNQYFFYNELFPLKEVKFGPMYIKIANNPLPYLNRAFYNWESIGIIGSQHCVVKIPFNLTINDYV